MLSVVKISVSSLSVVKISVSLLSVVLPNVEFHVMPCVIMLLIAFFIVMLNVVMLDDNRLGFRTSLHNNSLIT